MHAGGAAGPFGRHKIIFLVEDIFTNQVSNEISRELYLIVRFCQVTKGKKQNTGLYTPLPIPSCAMGSSYMNFALGLPRTLRKHSSILVVLNRFFKMTHFIPCSKIADASLVAHLFM